MKGAKRKFILPAVIVVVVVAVLAVGGYLLERTARKPGPEKPDRGKTVEEILGLGEDEEAPVNFDGKWYIRRPDVESYLLIGVDREGEAQDSGSYNGGGQADVLLLLVVDNGASSFRVLQLNRDTMADVEVLGVRGDVTGTEYQQLALAHHYGNGLEKSCENTVRAVSRLLYGMKIDGYAAIQFEAFPILNDRVGGVTVTVEDDFSAVDPTLVQGETVTLKGEQALHFIRIRHQVGDGSNLERMGRHRAYLSGFDAAFTAAMEQNQELPLKLYAAVSDYLVTDMGSGTVAELARRCQGYENGGVITVDGEAKLGERYMEFYPDEDSLRRAVLELFYQEKAVD